MDNSERKGDLATQRSVFDAMAKQKYEFFSSSDQEAVNRDFVIWLAIGLLPYSEINSPELKYFFSKHAPKIQILMSPD
jgi:hypothetical protein